MKTRFAKYIWASAVLFISCTSSSKQETVLDTSVTSPADTERPVAPSVIYRSMDHGNLWSPFADGIPEDATVSCFLYQDNATYATTDDSGIHVIKDGESKWKRIDRNLPEDVDINAIAYVKNIFIIGTLAHGIFTSQDGGYHWTQSSDFLNYTSIRCLLSYKDIVFAGTDQGIYKSVDKGYSWKQLYKGVQTNGFTVYQNKIYAALMNGAIITHDEGLTWNYVYQPHALHDISSDDEYVYAMTLGMGLLKSKNDGVSWENINGGFGPTRLYTFEVKRMDEKIFAGQWYGIYSSADEGKSWTMMKNGLPDSMAFTTLAATSTGLIAGIGLRKN